MKINDRVKILDVVDGKRSVKSEKGVIIYIGRRALVQFDSCICGHDGNGIGKKGYCWMCDFDKLREV